MAAEYRRITGLSKTLPLAAPSVSASISKRQLANYAKSSRLRSSFATGQRMARSGELSRMSVAASAQRREQTRAIQRATLSKGRESTRLRGNADRLDRMRGLGFASVEAFLCASYAAGASMDELAKVTRLGRAQLRVAMSDAGIVIRPTGANSTEGKRSRALQADRVAARKVGTDDLQGWLLDRRSQGWTLTQLGHAVDHSGAWVRWRLEREILTNQVSTL
jgi:hypothetical protein